MLEKKFNHARLKEKPKSTFGKKPYKGTKKGRSGSLKKSASTRNPLDRKSTRLNSSHQIISYAVFCLKQTKQTTSAIR